MPTKIKIEEMPNILEDVIQDDWLPLGQRMLQAGYKLITKGEIAKKLGGYDGYEDLNHYVESKIPEKVIEKVREARKLGIKEFRIYYVDKDDPIITGSISENKRFFIVQW